MNVLAATSGSVAFDFQFVIHPCQRQHIADMIFTFLSCFSSISAHHSLHLENALGSEMPTLRAGSFFNNRFQKIYPFPTMGGMNIPFLPRCTILSSERKANELSCKTLESERSDYISKYCTKNAKGY